MRTHREETKRKKDKTRAMVARAYNSKIFVFFLHRSCTAGRAAIKKNEFHITNVVHLHKNIFKSFLCSTLLTVLFCVFWFIHCVLSGIEVSNSTPPMAGRLMLQ
jgi:hypothetical protein